MIALYRPGSSMLHRWPTGTKIGALICLSLLISVYGSSWPVLAAAAAIVIGGFVAAGLGLRELAAQVWLLRWLVLITAVPQLVFLGWVDALLNTARVVTVVLLAALVTLTTPMTSMLDFLERSLASFRRFGVQPQRVALLCSLTIATVPVIAGLASQLREALRARGRRGGNPRILLPLLVLSLRHADELGDALRARGLDE